MKYISKYTLVGVLALMNLGLSAQTFNHLLSNPEIATVIKGVGFQWEGGQILPRILKEHPEYRYISSESECSNGDMDWKAAEHTFHLINHYLGHGCNEYNNWNMVLSDQGESAWG